LVLGVGGKQVWSLHTTLSLSAVASYNIVNNRNPTAAPRITIHPPGKHTRERPRRGDAFLEQEWTVGPLPEGEGATAGYEVVLRTQTDLETGMLVHACC